jgi:hypothetical protein
MSLAGASACTVCITGTFSDYTGVVTRRQSILKIQTIEDRVLEIKSARQSAVLRVGKWEFSDKEARDVGVNTIIGLGLGVGVV